MVYTYASSYISGFEKPIKTVLKERVKDVVIIKHFDGLVIYKTSLEFTKLQLPCFNNTYQVLDMAESSHGLPYEVALKKFVKQSKLDFSGILKNIAPLKGKSFKILPFDGNSPTGINFDLVSNLEEQIKRNLNLKIDFRRHDFDVILSRRSEGFFFVLFKLTYNRMGEKDLKKGELRPELCHILARISDIKPNDILIDPFCGHGSIPKEIVRNFNYNMLFASDIDKDLINKLKLEFKKNKKNLFIKQRDALNLEYFEDGFFDKITTDPPWNLYNAQVGDFSLFYKKMLKEFYRVLKSQGICVILMGNIENFEQALDDNMFKLLEKYHTLVNGKKANVYKLIKV